MGRAGVEVERVWDQLRARTNNKWKHACVDRGDDKLEVLAYLSLQ